MQVGFDVQAFVRLYLPPTLRTVVRCGWMAALAAPLDKMWQVYDLWRTEARYAAAVTGQKIVLEAYLNRIFDPTQKRITISTGVSWGQWVAYDPTGDASGVDYVCDGMAVGTAEQQGEDTACDFAVQIPSVLSSRSADIRSVVAKYAIVGASFKITTF